MCVLYLWSSCVTRLHGITLSEVAAWHSWCVYAVVVRLSQMSVDDLNDDLDFTNSDAVHGRRTS